jgi:hypothetical protein
MTGRPDRRAPATGSRLLRWPSTRPEPRASRRAGALPTWAYVRGALAATWPMVSASYLPLLALVMILLKDLALLHLH